MQEKASQSIEVPEALRFRGERDAENAKPTIEHDNGFSASEAHEIKALELAAELDFAIGACDSLKTLASQAKHAYDRAQAWVRVTHAALIAAQDASSNAVSLRFAAQDRLDAHLGVSRDERNRSEAQTAYQQMLADSLLL